MTPMVSAPSDLATSATTGAEVDVATGVRLLKAIGSTTMCLVEVNLPGALSVAGP